MSNGSGGDAKPFWASKTMWGAVATFLGVILPGLGVQVSPTAIAHFTDSLQQAIDSVLVFGGLVLTVYGRSVASGKLTMS
jgi:hypothetical protein